MNTNFLLPVFRRVALAGIVLLSLTQCRQQEEAAVAAPEVDKSKVEKLLDRAYQRGSAQSYAAITADYAQLNAEEVTLFFQLKTERDLKRLDQMRSQGTLDLSDADLGAARHSIRLAAEMRLDVNKRAEQEFGMPMNKVEQGKLLNLVVKVASDDKYLGLGAGAGISSSQSKAGRVQACTSASFPNVATIVNDGFRDWSDWTQRSTPSAPADCDFEYRFFGNYTKWDPTDWFAEQLGNAFNNTIARRRTGFDSGTYNTYLLFGNRGVYLWIGYPGLLSIRMRP